MPPERVPLSAEWVQQTEGEAMPDSMPAELSLLFEAGTLFIDGLRGGQYLTLDLVDLMDAMVRSERSAAVTR